MIRDGFGPIDGHQLQILIQARGMHDRCFHSRNSRRNPSSPVIERVAVGEYPTSGVRHQSHDGIWPGFSAISDRIDGS
jgi:hypothetical protein